MVVFFLVHVPRHLLIFVFGSGAFSQIHCFGVFSPTCILTPVISGLYYVGYCHGVFSPICKFAPVISGL